MSPRGRNFGSPFSNKGGYSPRGFGLGGMQNETPRGRFGNPHDNRFGGNPTSMSPNGNPYERFNPNNRFGPHGGNRFNRPGGYPDNFGGRGFGLPNQNSRYGNRPFNNFGQPNNHRSSIGQNSAATDLRSAQQSAQKQSPRFGNDTNPPGLNNMPPGYPGERPNRFSNYSNNRFGEGGYQNPNQRYPRHTADPYNRQGFNHPMDPYNRFRDRSTGYNRNP
jgi:hypothetical protein